MRRIMIISEFLFMVMSWVIIDTIIFLDHYSSTPYYYSGSEFIAYFKAFNHLILFLIPILFGLKTHYALNESNGLRLNLALLKVIYILIACGLLPHIIFWLHRVISFTIYARFFQFGLFTTVFILLAFLILTFFSLKRISGNHK